MNKKNIFTGIFDYFGINDKLKNNIRENRWKILLFIVIGSVLTVVYISNVREINALLAHKRKLERKLENTKAYNEELNSELIRLKSPERIDKIAKEKLGMVLPKKAPLILEKNGK